MSMHTDPIQLKLRFEECVCWVPRLLPRDRRCFLMMLDFYGTRTCTDSTSLIKYYTKLTAWFMGKVEGRSNGRTAIERQHWRRLDTYVVFRSSTSCADPRTFSLLIDCFLGRRWLTVEARSNIESYLNDGVKLGSTHGTHLVRLVGCVR